MLEDQWQILRLFQVQQLLSENLNVPLRILRGDALESLESLSPRFGKVEEALLKPSDESNPFGENLDADVLAALSPKDPVARSRVSLAIWRTPRSAPNPLYEELKGSTPSLQALIRLNILRKFFSLGGSAEGKERFEALELPAGLVGLLIPLREKDKNGDVLIVGPCRLLASDEETKPPGGDPLRVVKMESKVQQIVSQVEALRAKPFTPEDKTNFIVLGTAYFAVSKEHMWLKGITAKRVFAKCHKLIHDTPEIVRTMATANWNRAAQRVFFWQSERSIALLQSYVSPPRCPAASHLPDFLARCHLHEGKAPGEATFLLEVQGSITAANEGKLEQLEFRLSQAQVDASEGRFGVYVGGMALDKQAQEKLEYFYHRSVEDRASNRAWQDYLAFDRLRHELQNLKVDAFAERAELFTRRARSVVTADVAAFFEYDSLSDSLSLGCSRTGPWIEKADEQHLRKWLQEIAQDSERRSQSMLYRAIDTLCYQSRLIVQQESRPFAVGLVKDLELIPVDREIWGIEPADVIVVPIQFHERLIGALYLVSATADRFTYADRVRLLTFVKMFEAELFKAKLFQAIGRMNEYLEKALSSAMPQEEFFGSLMEEVAKLLAVQCSILWWRKETGSQAFQVLGHKGQVPPLLNVRLEEKELKFLQADQNPVAIPLTKGSMPGPLKEIPQPHCSVIPLRGGRHGNLVGLVSVHGKMPLKVGEVLGHELAFILGELAKNVGEFMEHHARLGSFREISAHGVQSALMHLDNIKVRLQRYGKRLSPQEQGEYDLQLADMKRAIGRARFLLDWLTSESVQEKVTDEDPLGPLKYLKNSLAQRISVHEVVKTSFHGRANDLSKRGVHFHFEGPHLPSLWLDKGEVELVFTNLVDNIVKYAAPHQEISIDYSTAGMKYCVAVVSKGTPLREELREVPDRIFEERMRGAAEEIAARTGGKGQGLFASRRLAQLWQGDLRLQYQHQDIEATYRFFVDFPKWLAAETNPWRGSLY